MGVSDGSVHISTAKISNSAPRRESSSQDTVLTLVYDDEASMFVLSKIQASSKRIVPPEILWLTFYLVHTFSLSEEDEATRKSLDAAMLSSSSLDPFLDAAGEVSKVLENVILEGINGGSLLQLMQLSDSRIVAVAERGMEIVASLEMEEKDLQTETLAEEEKDNSHDNRHTFDSTSLAGFVLFILTILFTTGLLTAGSRRKRQKEREAASPQLGTFIGTEAFLSAWYERSADERSFVTNDDQPSSLSYSYASNERYERDIVSMFHQDSDHQLT